MRDTPAGALFIDTFKELFDFSRDVLWIISPEGLITYVSPAVELLRGIDAETAMSQSIDQIHPPESAQRSIEYFSYLMEAIQKGSKPQPFRGTLEYYHADGSIVTTDVYAVPAVNCRGELQFLAGLSRDISARLLAETRERAEQEQRDLRFLYHLDRVLEHEIRNALAIISLALSDKNDQQPKIKAANRSINSLLGLLNQISSFATSSFNADHQLKPLCLRDIAACADRKLSVKPEVQFDFSYEVHVMGSVELLQTVFVQLLSNAKKYSPPGNSVVVAVDESYCADEPYIALCVSNDHIALGALEVDLLCEPFYRATYVSSLSGTGLGLTIARKILDILGGSLHLNYDGSKFTATIRLLKA